MVEKIQSKEIFGAEIQYFRLDPEYWEKIIKKLKDSGLRCITTYVQWGTHIVGEPDNAHPIGILDFEGRTNPRLNLKRFLELVKKYDLNLNFRSGPFCCNEMIYGGYPKWLVLGDPNMMVWDYQNRTTQGYWIAKREGSQPSYLHPDYLKLCREWIYEVDKIIIPNLKSNGGCITMLNLDNEVSYIVQDGFLSSDYNPVNISRGGFYHQFLKQKYGSAENLPYGREYSCIEDVEPPRSVENVIGKDLAWYLDWAEFKQWVMAEYVKRLREMHESNGVDDVYFMTNLNPHLPEGIPTRMPAFEEACNGIVGYDFYRGTFMSYSGYHSMARVLKLMNASLKYTWSSEFMSGTWNKVLESRVSDDHMRFMARCALAHGCKAIDWFMFHDRECWGDAPVSIHGQVRPSYDVLKEVPDLLFNKIKSWDALVPQGDAAIIYDLVQHRHTFIGDPSPCADNDLHIGAPVIEGTEAGRSSKEYMGLFRLVEESGCQANVVDIMHSRCIPSQYPVVFMPGSPVIEEQAAKALKDYMEEGGVVILTGAWPMVNEFGRHIKFLGMEKPSVEIKEMVVKFGKGKLIWNSKWIAQDEPEEESMESIKLVKTWLEQCSVEPNVRITNTTEMQWGDWNKVGGGIMTYKQPRNLGSAVLQVSDEESILFVLNHYPEASTFDLELKNRNYTKMENLSSGEVINLVNGKATVDIDRKSCEIYRVE